MDSNYQGYQFSQAYKAVLCQGMIIDFSVSQLYISMSTLLFIDAGKLKHSCQCMNTTKIHRQIPLTDYVSIIYCSTAVVRVAVRLCSSYSNRSCHTMKQLQSTVPSTYLHSYSNLTIATMVLHCMRPTQRMKGILICIGKQITGLQTHINWLWCDIMDWLVTNMFKYEILDKLCQSVCGSCYQHVTQVEISILCGRNCCLN